MEKINEFYYSKMAAGGGGGEEEGGGKEGEEGGGERGGRGGLQRAGETLCLMQIFFLPFISYKKAGSFHIIISHDFLAVSKRWQFKS